MRRVRSPPRATSMSRGDCIYQERQRPRTRRGSFRSCPGSCHRRWSRHRGGCRYSPDRKHDRRVPCEAGATCGHRATDGPNPRGDCHASVHNVGRIGRPCTIRCRHTLWSSWVRWCSECAADSLESGNPPAELAKHVDSTIIPANV